MVFKGRLHICTVKLYSQSNKVNITNNNDDGNYMNITKLIFDIICTKLTRSVSTEWYFYGHNETLLLPVAGTLGNAKTAWSTLKSTQGGGGRVRGEGGGGGGGHPVEQELSLSFIFLPAWLNQLSLSFLLIFFKTKNKYLDSTFFCQIRSSIFFSLTESYIILNILFPNFRNGSKTQMKEEYNSTQPSITKVWVEAKMTLNTHHKHHQGYSMSANKISAIADPILTKL